MSERYWNSGDVDAELADFANEQVCAALKQTWETDPPLAWIDDERKDRVVMIVGGPEKPVSAADLDSPIDIYAVEFDVLHELELYADPYAPNGPCSEEQRRDMAERVAVLRKLSDDIAALAARVEQAG